MPIASWRAPRVFGLVEFNTRRDFLRGLRRLRDLLFRGTKPVVLDFSDVERLYAEGTLLFTAELRRLIRLTGGKRSVTGTVPCNDKVAQVLKQLGVLDLLGVQCDVIPMDEDVIHWRHAHGHKVNGAAYEDVLAEYDGEIADVIQEQLYTGITEAMTNVLNHAYILPRGDGIPSKHMEWCMFSQQKDGHLNVVFVDLGAGIPPTLRQKRPSVFERAFRTGNGRDANVIAHALQDSISRTNQGHRGKGLSQIVGLIDHVPGGRVRVMSNRGSIERHHGAVPDQREYSDSIMGTLINWRIPLQSKEVV